MNKVLLVEDNEVQRQMLAMILAKKQYIVSAVSDPNEAKDAIKGGWMPDILLTDYIMGSGNGCELARWLRAYPGGHRPGIVLMTAAGNGNYEALRSQLGDIQAELLSKPFEPELLYNALARLATTLDKT